jgi:hypothetical protein
MAGPHSAPVSSPASAAANDGSSLFGTPILRLRRRRVLLAVMAMRPVDLCGVGRRIIAGMWLFWPLEMLDRTCPPFGTLRSAGFHFDGRAQPFAFEILHSREKRGRVSPLLPGLSSGPWIALN